jgi:hypothetical protein
MEIVIAMLIKAIGIVMFGLLMALGFNLGNMLNQKLGLIQAH